MRLVLLSLFLVCGDVLLFCLVLDVVRDLCPLSFCTSSSIRTRHVCSSPIDFDNSGCHAALSLSLYHFTLWSVIHCTFYIDAGECHIIHYVTPCKQGHQVVYELRAPTIAPHPHWTIGVTSVNDVARHRGQDHVLRERCLLWRVWF